MKNEFVKLSIIYLIVLYQLFNTINGHAFTICPNTIDHLHVTQISFTPDPPKGGQDFSATIVLKPDTSISKGTATVIGKVLGLKVIHLELDVCKFVKCPLEANKESKLSFSYPLPTEVPEHVELNLQITIHDDSNNLLSCITTKVDTYESNIIVDDSQKINNYLKSTIDHLNNNNFGGKKSVIYMYKLWLEQFHQSAQLDWYPIHELDDVETKEEKKQMFESKLIIFAENLARIISHNRKYRKGEVTYAMSLNDFAHLHNKEFADMYLNGYQKSLSKKSSSSINNKISKVWNIFTDKASTLIRIPQEIFKADNNNNVNKKNDELPSEFDWTTKGAVSPIKNQGSCGSCWAFSAIQALEGAYFIKYGELKTFSEQQLVSCEHDCYGCNGGLMDIAFAFIKRNGGICSEKDYPYSSGVTGMNGFCRSSKCKIDPKSAIQSIVDVDHTEDALMAAVTKSPVSIAIEADQYAFQFYSHGVLTADCGDHLDHGVLLTGYGTLDDIPFWKVKNSWGANWGMNGYILLQRGKKVPNGDEECGILANPSYPVL